MAILVVADFEPTEWAHWKEHLERSMPQETFACDRRLLSVGDIDVALVANPPRGGLTALPGLRLIHSLWAGVDGLLSDPSVPAHVPLVRMVDPEMAQTMAQTALWSVLGVHRQFFDYAAAQRQARWSPQDARGAAQDWTIAVLGLGQMGMTVAADLAAHGYRVLGWRRQSTAPAPRLELHTGPAGLDAVLRQADVVINLLPLTAQTRHLFCKPLLSTMKKGAAFANFGRGSQVVEADLLSALDEGHLSRAILDVFETEPLPAGHRFWSHPAVTVLPHVAAQTHPRSASQVVARNIATWRAGGAVADLVDRARGY